MEHELIGKLRAKVSTVRFGSPARGLKVIAVAGPAGKTTTALLLGEILRESGSRVMVLTNRGCTLDGESYPASYDASPDSFNRYLSMAKKRAVDMLVVEVSLALLKTQLLPSVALEMVVVTGEHDTVRALLREPTEHVVLPVGLEVDEPSVAPHKSITYGDDPTSDAHVSDVTQLRKGTELTLTIDHQTKFEIATYLIGGLNIKNIAAAVSAAYVLAADMSKVQEGVANLEGVAGNFEYLEITDAPYAVALDAVPVKSALESVVETARSIKRRRLLLCADSSVALSELTWLSQQSDRLIVVGTEPEAAPSGVDWVATTDAAFELAKRAAKKDDLIVLLGKDFAAYDQTSHASTFVLQVRNES